MRAIAPRTGAPEVTVAEEQPEYLPITVAMYEDEHGAVYRVTRWTFSPEERERIARGEDVYVSQVSFGQAPMTPLMVNCGPADWMDVPAGQDAT